MAEYLAANGWNVTMITGFPHYPEWKIHKSYRTKKTFYSEVIKGVHVKRYKHFVPKNPSFFKRIIQLIDFTGGSYFNLLKIKKTDVVLSIIPFTSSAWLGQKFARKFKCRHWIHIQDFEFDAATESGMFPKHKLGSGLLKSLYKTERKTLDSADLVSTISKGMISKLKLRTESQTYFFPNWLNEKFIDPSSADHHPFFNREKFSVLYSGNIGNKQDWDTFLRVVEAYSGDDSIEFIVIGDGAMRKNLEARVRHMNHVKIYDPIPFENLNDLLCSADLHILFQKDNVVDTVMPSKLLGMMASEVPCLVTGSLDSEIVGIFNSKDSGYYIQSDETAKIVSKINELSDQRGSTSSMGKRAREIVIESFSKEKVLNRFAEKLISLDED